MARIIDAFMQFFDDNGEPLVNGKLKFVESGTNNTDKDTFADINETIANANPVPLDGAGRCPNIFGTGTYNVISFTSDDVQIQQFDPVSSDPSLGAFSEWDSVTIYGEGALVTGDDGLYYRSITAANQNQDPVSSPGQWEQIKFVGVWNTTVVYAASDVVYGSDGLFYISRISSNSGNDPISDDANWRLLNDSPDLLNNVGFTATVVSKALTFALKTNDLSDPTSADKVIAAFRSSTLTTGNYDVISAVTALNIIVPDGATLGFAAAATDFVYLYALNNAGTMELAVSGSILDETVLHTTVAIDATADSDSVLYSTTLRADVPIRLIGRTKIATGAVAGEWDNAPTELNVGSPTDTTNSQQLAKAWVNFNGTGTVAIRDSFNVDSITDNGTGDYTVNFTSGALSDGNYAAIGGSNAVTIRVPDNTVGTHTAAALRLQTYNATHAVNDYSQIQITVFGD